MYVAVALRDMPIGKVAAVASPCLGPCSPPAARRLKKLVRMIQRMGKVNWGLSLKLQFMSLCVLSLVPNSLYSLVSGSVSG